MPPQLLDEFGVLVCLFSSLMAGGSGLQNPRLRSNPISLPMNTIRLHLIGVLTLITVSFLVASAAEMHMEHLCAKYQPLNSCNRQ